MPRNRRDNIQRDCTTIKQRLYALLDGALPPQEERSVRAHLQNCVSCNSEWTTIRHTEIALQSAREALPSAGDLSAGFYAKLAQAQNPPRRSLFKTGWFVAVPTMAMGVCAFLLLRPHTETPLVIPRPISSAPSATETARVPPSKKVGSPTMLGENILPELPKRNAFRNTKNAVIVANVPQTHKNHASTTFFRSLQLSVTADSRGLSLGRYNESERANLRLAEARVLSENPKGGDIDIEVVDTERGFESKNRVLSEEVESNGIRTVTIDETETASRVETVSFQEQPE